MTGGNMSVGHDDDDHYDDHDGDGDSQWYSCVCGWSTRLLKATAVSPGGLLLTFVLVSRVLWRVTKNCA